MKAYISNSTIQRIAQIAESYRASYWLWPLGVFLIAYGMQRSVALLGLDLHHDAFMFDAAKRLLDGELPFKDFFYQYNLGTVAFHMLALKAYGTYISSLKLATSISYALIAMLIYICSAVLKRPWHGLGMALIWTVLSPFYMPSLDGYHPWSTVYMMASVMLGTASLLLATKQKSVWLSSSFAGVCFSLAFWFKQVAGLQILFVIAWMLLNMRRSAVGTDVARQYRNMFIGYALGGLIAALPFFAYLYMHGLFYDWWRSAFVFNRYFALTGPYSSSLYFFLRAVFPVARDLGYISTMWAILPLYLLLMLAGPYKGANLLPLGKDGWSRQASLLLVLGLAGWIEYFPMPHSFHTQLFMAPTFVLIALGLNRTAGAYEINWRSRTATLFVSFMLLITVYEAAVHVWCYRGKISQTRETIEVNSPAKGLKLYPEYSASYKQFYQEVRKSLRGREQWPAIPLSADPLRAIFPFSRAEKSTFKMGVDWTWPNELVEPGFNQRLYKLIAERRAPIYGDSLLAIPGYIPISLLEMPSPLGRFHTLYLPSADKKIRPAAFSSISNIYLLKGNSAEQGNLTLNDKPDTSQKTKSGVDEWTPQQGCAAPIYQQEVLVPFDSQEPNLAELDQLNVAIISDSEIPRSLSGLEYAKFMVPAMQGFGEMRSADNFYGKMRDGSYGLKPSLTESDWQYLARFFLYRGKLKKRLATPRFTTTLAQSEKDRPFIVSMPEDNQCPRVIWSKAHRYTAGVHYGHGLYLAIPMNRFVDAGPMTFYVQQVMKDGTTIDRYLRYGYEGSGAAGE